MLSSITVSFGGGFPLSFSEEDRAGTASTFFGSASAGADADWTTVSGAEMDFMMLKGATGEAALGSCEEPNSPATSFRCWPEDVLEAGDRGSSVCGSVAVVGWRLGEGGWTTLTAGRCCDLKKHFGFYVRIRHEEEWEEKR